ncbi:PhnD/SsuA/transferrin family substrate-binding protein [Aestuariicoccus sp. MJ-SS9]|uniref:PhnD/SsuA/transferrin family substrate-binding protein n=1 Tax=Aestuariicoccus sp. MJ-SS9 TaxID=3079855 RepID=UPI0029118EDF|nr:PhnD/SsuA/transferrin family substrate-binding protein [Aestuariicoccus sp. MJ-SS9]MDU8910231.1 PhnD/SsuA/transferrin family substrate-binding protein [Aestuariicoccus sp. MJ-SS9]
MIASLPMYWRAETADAWQALWTRASAERAGWPQKLLPPEALGDLAGHWTSPDLLVSQTCGLPFRSALRGRVRYVATPDFALPGSPPGYYRSVAVMRRGDRRGWDELRLAYNGGDSQSGWAAAVEAFAARNLPLPRSRLHSGAHAASARAVAENRADLAFIDAVTWRLIERFDSVAARLEVVHETAPTPGLPLITGQPGQAPALREALGDAIRSLPDASRAALGGLSGLCVLPEARYLEMPLPPPVTAETA